MKCEFLVLTRQLLGVEMMISEKRVSTETNECDAY